MKVKNLIKSQFSAILCPMQVACTWEDVKSLRQDMERCTSTSLVHLRSKLLQAANQLQVRETNH